jgi:hypothetical protein
LPANLPFFAIFLFADSLFNNLDTAKRGSGHFEM